MLAELQNAKKVVGNKQLCKALKEGTVAKVFLAENAEARITAPIEQQCAAANIPVVRVPTMEELGKACSIEVGAAAAAILR